MGLFDITKILPPPINPINVKIGDQSEFAIPQLQQQRNKNNNINTQGSEAVGNNEDPHKSHAIGLAAVTAAVANLTMKKSIADSVMIAAVVGGSSYLYMRKYGHALP